MRRSIGLLSLFAVCLASGVLVWSYAAAQPEKPMSRKNLWKEVDAAMEKGLPKTAVEKLGPIVEGAKKDKSWAEAIRATGLRIALEGNVQGNKPEEKIERMRAEIEAAPAEMKPVMRAILAHWYWHYFQANRWRIMQRTETGVQPGDDVTTWSVARILDEVEQQFDAALAERDTLRKTPIADYGDLLVDGTMPDTYRPTLYDFLVHEALAFHTSGEANVTQPEDDFKLAAGSAALAPAADFLAWKIEDPSGSRISKALGLYQELMRFHADAEDRTAYFAADLDRLRFAHANAIGNEKDARYVAVLKAFVDADAEHALASRACHDWASVLQGQDELVEAREVALRGRNLHAESVGGKMCHNVVVEIEQKHFQVTSERVWNEPWPQIDVNYRNLSKLHFRLVKGDWVDRLQQAKRRPEWLDGNERKAILKKEPAKAWSVDLKPTPDYQPRNAAVDVPEGLERGFYHLLASHDADFGDTDNQVQFTDVWVSDLALVVRQHNGETKLDGFVLEANSGHPVAGATVELWRSDRNQYTKVKSVETDENGLFDAGVAKQKHHLLRVVHEGDELVSEQDFYSWSYDRTSKPDEQTVFFTDRALYRPGQTIRFKGIAFFVDQQRDDYQVLPNRDAKVIFADVNGETIEELKVRTNAYGSFNGSVTAPRDRLMGHMTLRIDGEPSGSVGFRVEEYKRPKFQVEFAAAEEAPRLGNPVTLTGTATAYTGAAIDGAKVRWRVVRRTRLPYWWYWSSLGRGWRFPQGDSREIAHGTATTGTDGTFEVTFDAIPDKSVPEESQATFSYEITADVTDTAGETRSAQKSTSVGYVALQASLSAEQWLTAKDPVELAIRTTSLDGESRPAKGTVKVHRLNPPASVQRPLLQQNYYRQNSKRAEEQEIDLSDPQNWPLGDVVVEKPFETDESGSTKLSVDLEVGAFQAVLETQDRFGKPVTTKQVLIVVDPDAEKLALKVPFLFRGPTFSVEPGDQLVAIWGSGYDTARAFVEIEHRDKLLAAYWTDPNRTQVKITREITEAMRGGFTVRVTMIRENRAHTISQHVSVPWSNKQLTVKWERFVSKLKPGQEESFTAVVTGPDAERSVAEMVATLYDASLDQYARHAWLQAFGVFRHDYSNVSTRFENQVKYLQHMRGSWASRSKSVDERYRAFPMEIVGYLHGYQWLQQRRGQGGKPGDPKGNVKKSPPAPGFTQGLEQFNSRDSLAANGEFSEKAKDLDRADGRGLGPADKQAGGLGGGGEAAATPEVAPRTNLAETAFFLPHLVASKEGEVRMEFTMPEALTEWRFMGFAHDAQLRSGFLEGSTLTAKDLMIQPNPPRFVREGDVLEFTVKVTNQSDVAQNGVVQLSFSDARTNNLVSDALGIEAADQAFEVPAKESRTYSWRITIPDGMGFLTYKAVGASDRLSDGEEGFLPVLPRRILVTESLPLPIRGDQTKKFSFEHLLKSGNSDSLQHESLTVQMVSNPSWYAVMALPYLMEYPHQCNEQVFNRLYANALARHIATSDPRIEKVFAQWRATPALDSPLHQNEDLKSLLVEETPWLRQANAESQARRNVGILFDQNRLKTELARAQRQLAEAQLPDGSWSWFPGGRRNEYITLYIVTGFGRMRHLGVDVDANVAVKAVDSLDTWIDRIYRGIKPEHRKENHLSSTIALYLYGRSFFLKDKPVAEQHAEAVNYFRGQAKKYWLDLAVRQSQGHLAIALNRWDDPETAKAIMASIAERSVTNEEMGMFWRDTEAQWWWYRAPIETQALMIEAFEEVLHDDAAVEECKVWLLKQKQTRDWKTTKATADAVYGLLLRGGTNVLASDQLVEVTIGQTTIEPADVEAGTGFYEQRFAGAAVKPDFGSVTVVKKDAGVAWGAVHWQYLEDVSKIPVHQGTPLVIRKSLWRKVHTKDGPKLERIPVESDVRDQIARPLEVGEELVTRVEIRVDRDMEYVHLKDQRGSGTEPVDVLSGYRYRDGLAYYQSTRDTASHFFIDYLPKGNYVFEYSNWVVHRGRYQSGLASIECMYAPEFNSHSNSVELKVE